jgi:hypothetical protein
VRAVIETLILIGGCCRNLALSAHRSLSRQRLRLGEGMRIHVYAKLVIDALRISVSA